MRGKILILDDEEKMASLIARSLERSGYTAVATSDPQEALTKLKEERFDVLVTDLRMPGMDGLEILSRARAIDSGIEVVVMTAYASIDTVREAMKRGAVDYLEKPISAENDLKPLLERLIGNTESREEKVPAIRSIETEKAALPSNEIECQSSVMQEIYRKALKVAKSNASVLLRGESGTGKEVLADYIQRNSNRAKMPYVKINCGALPETLLESELFGHVRGSFTGATSDRAGLFSVADGGTIMLDEVGEVSPALQVKLLRVLQQGEFQRVGDSATNRVDVRVIAATNRSLERMIEEGDFRRDLYYRLNVVPFELPPLHERPEDLETLIEHFSKRFSGGKKLRITQAASDAMLSYSWPGNIRELENAIEHAVVLGDGESIDIEDLPVAVQIGTPPEPSSSGGAVPDGKSGGSLEEIEKKALLQALDKTRGNRTRAARLLQITRRTLGYRLQKYGLEEQIRKRYGAPDVE